MSPPDGATGFLPFHRDELAAQALAGEGAGIAPIRPFMPDQHRAFFASLPYLFVATADAEGWPVASVLAGKTGFVQSPDPVTLRLDAIAGANDPAAAGLAIGREVGLLGLDLTNRRRNRANGQLTEVDDDGLTVRVAQSFGNCAQYIQTRRPTAVARTVAPVEALDGLDDAARALIATADTFFVASGSRPGIGGNGGLDMSHRGGRPGFVGVHGNTLAIPDFRGNRFFNTLGNLLGDPRTGLLFVDFATGELLQLQGRAEITWTPGNAGPDGAERLWRVKVERGWRRRGAFPFTWAFGDYAPTTLKTGVW
ncbi:MAG: pyridoxamine 5'-phosphate oxidase [Reyranella sp.]|uniref:pyridoxamine 5'-phosphate oxidase family protein n=1 Tax=Reyranella sp. TaxID=1929291 RepID=UPI001209F9E5|nr:pyridoxamine 5'-phosphate oxidase family protein [Reyranella sp.]TAJ38202.1 MAG: pyridoxamine 5'-phosphate oxidase [Reyranella sp.]